MFILCCYLLYNILYIDLYNIPVIIQVFVYIYTYLYIIVLYILYYVEPTLAEREIPIPTIVWTWNGAQLGDHLTEDPSNRNVFIQESGLTSIRPPGGSSFSSRFWSGKEMPWWGERKVVCWWRNAYFVGWNLFFNGEVGCFLFWAEIEAEMPYFNIFQWMPTAAKCIAIHMYRMDIIACTWYIYI